MRLIRDRRLAIALAVPALCLAGPASSALASTPAPSITQITPASGPEFSSVPVKIHGRNFNTAPGETLVTFGGTEALSVTCSSSRLCTATTPELPEGSVPVTVTSNGMTATSPEEFTYEKYDPPLVKIEKSQPPIFSTTLLTDRYPGIFDPGNVYLQIENTTNETLFFVEEGRWTFLKHGEVAGLNIPIRMLPYRFTLEDGLFAHQHLTVWARTPLT